MATIEEWKRRIVKFFIFPSKDGLEFRVKSEQEVFRYFASNFEKNTQKAYNELWNAKIIQKYPRFLGNTTNTYYTLNFDEKSQEIESIVKHEPFEATSSIIKPTNDDFEGLNEEFRDASTRGWPNRGFYYFCTKIDDPSYWVVLIKTKPNVKPYRIKLESLKDKKSRISKIWKATVKISKSKNHKPFIRKWVENIEQKACGNNRLPSRSAFQIFVHLGWLKIVGCKGNTIYYQITPKGKRHQ